jgi:hypothetical protein
VNNAGRTKPKKNWKTSQPMKRLAWTKVSLILLSSSPYFIIVVQIQPTKIEGTFWEKANEEPYAQNIDLDKFESLFSAKKPVSSEEKKLPAKKIGLLYSVYFVWMVDQSVFW